MRSWLPIVLGGAILIGFIPIVWKISTTPDRPAPPPEASATGSSSPSTSAPTGHRHDARTEASARAEASSRPYRISPDPDLQDATDSARSANSGRDGRENVPAPHEVARMLDEIIARLERRVAEARAAGDEQAAARLEVRLGRMRRDRAYQQSVIEGATAPSSSAAPSDRKP